MTMTVGIGLKRFCWAQDDALQAQREAAVAIVESRLTDLIRDIIGEGPDQQVAEATWTEECVHYRIVSPEEAAPILKDAKKTFKKYDTFASFSWDETDRLGIWNAQPLALEIDHSDVPPEVTLPGNDPMKVISLDDSESNYGVRHRQNTIARALHGLARRHRLVVNTG